VAFDIKQSGVEAEIVHSLAKWKRHALGRYGFTHPMGLLTDMNAIRRDEEADNIHSIYVDQWDWERVLCKKDRNEETLKEMVRHCYRALRHTEDYIAREYVFAQKFLPEDIYFITSQELEDRYPDKTDKEREDLITREHGVVFLSQIGGKLASGKPHDSRAPDYDDWTLNGDLLVWCPVLGHALEISSMGIRVDAEALDRQLTESGCDDRRSLPFHQMLLNDELPLTIGGGIGQSRLCMLMMGCCHIGEVQASVWDQATVDACEAAGIRLL
jgi:aspartate--ammonia ligase